MIPINEIRCGNWFNLEFIGPFQWECSHFDEYVKDKAKGYDVEGCIVSDKIEPIAITPEVLEKAGFVLQSGKWYHKKTPFYLEEFTLRVNVFTLCKSDVIIIFAVEYLHQLQNFIALTGEELTVNL